MTCFTHDANAEVDASCSLTWHNRFFVFGASSNTRQISEIVGTYLEVIGTLEFDHYFGTCDVMGSDKIWLCYNYNDSNDYKRCRVALNPLETFTQVQESTFGHRKARIAASNSESQLKYELFWKTLANIVLN